MFLYGAGGHAKVIIDVILTSTDYVIDGVYDDYSTDEITPEIPVVKVLPIRKEINEMIVSVGNNKIRKKITQSITAKYLTAIHFKAVVSKLNTKIGLGTVIMANAVVNPNSIIGKHCIINTASIVEHDCIIEDFVHISPNAALAGNVTVGEGTHIGLGANIIPGVNIGKWCVIGAGSTVIDDVPDFSVVVGCPAKFIKSNK